MTERQEAEMVVADFKAQACDAKPKSNLENGDIREGKRNVKGAAKKPQTIHRE